MAIRLVRNERKPHIYDHTLTLNREYPDQHPVEAITGLREELDSKYVKPALGIPKEDLSIDLMSLADLQGIKLVLEGEIKVVDDKVVVVSNRTTALEDFIANVYPTLAGNTELPDRTDLEFDPYIWEEFIAEADDVEFVLSTNYQPGNHSLKVFLNGALQRFGDDYTETSETIITFLFPLNSGDYVSLLSSGRTNINTPIHEEFEYLGDKIFNLHYRYNRKDNSLSVYYNGIRLTVNKEYTEIDDYTVEITKTGMTLGDVVIFRRETHMSAEVIINDTTYNAMDSWKETFIIGNSTTTSLTFAKQYMPNNGTLQVFVDGLLQDTGLSDDYIEDSVSTILFNYPIEIDAKVDVVCSNGMFVWTETFISVTIQRLFRLSNNYNINKGDILVYENGMLLTPVDDYEEVNFNTIRLVEAPDEGSKIKVYKRR